MNISESWISIYISCADNHKSEGITRQRTRICGLDRVAGSNIILKGAKSRGGFVLGAYTKLSSAKI